MRAERVELLEDEDDRLTRGRISGVERGEEEGEVLREGPEDPVPHHVLQVELLGNVPERHPVVSLHVTGQLDDHGVLLPARGGGGPAREPPAPGRTCPLPVGPARAESYSRPGIVESLPSSEMTNIIYQIIPPAYLVW